MPWPCCWPFFCCRLLLVPQGEGALPVESGSLPIDRTVVTPEPALDSAQQVKVKLADGTVETMALDDYLWGWWPPRCPPPLKPRL